jgi:hypothetical protein
MKSGTQRPYWGGFLTGAGLALLAMYFLKQGPLSADLYILIGIVGLGSLLVGAFLHSPLR